MDLDADRCYRVLQARDARFDGLFFVGVTTTGVYCRPICPARTPGRDRCTYHRSAAEAEHAGFRACFRCRPELAPGAASVDARSRLVTRAVARIEDGALDDGSVDDLAAELGVVARHLRRAVQGELGVSPLELAQTRRLALAKQLLHDSGLSLTEVAFAAGFGSVRRFNAAFAARFGSPPLRLRRAVRDERGGAPTFVLRLGYRAPFDWAGVLAYLAPRAIAGVEEVVDGRWRRAFGFRDVAGVIEVRDEPARACIVATVPVALAPAARTLTARLRALFDLDARPDAIAATFAGDRLLAARVRRNPGLRVPGAFDGFELAVRAVLGQQVSVRGATTIAARLAERLGEPLATGDRLARGFPDAARLAAARARGGRGDRHADRARPRGGRAGAGRGRAAGGARARARPRRGDRRRARRAPGGPRDRAVDRAVRRDARAALARRVSGRRSRRAQGARAGSTRTDHRGRRRAPRRVLAAVARVRRPAPVEQSRGGTMSTVTVTVTIDSPIGPLRLDARGGALTGLWLPEGDDPRPDAVPRPDDELLRLAAAQLGEYFAGTRTSFDVPLAPAGTAFQRLVWDALLLIPHGATWSYGQLAKQIGRPHASRAVGAANGRNPISIFIPCHRVIGASGQLTGYGGGLPAKRFLLELERAPAVSAQPYLIQRPSSRSDGRLP